MTTRRNELDIMADLVRVATQGSTKTGLVYNANLNFKVVKKYIKRMFDSGLLEKRDGLYYSTQKGIDFLERYSSTMNIFSEAPNIGVF